MRRSWSVGCGPSSSAMSKATSPPQKRYIWQIGHVHSAVQIYKHNKEDIWEEYNVA